MLFPAENFPSFFCICKRQQFSYCWKHKYFLYTAVLYHFCDALYNVVISAHVLCGWIPLSAVLNPMFGSNM